MFTLFFTTFCCSLIKIYGHTHKFDYRAGVLFCLKNGNLVEISTISSRSNWNPTGDKIKLMLKKTWGELDTYFSGHRLFGQIWIDINFKAQPPPPLLNGVNRLLCILKMWKTGSLNWKYKFILGILYGSLMSINR